MGTCVNQLHVSKVLLLWIAHYMEMVNKERSGLHFQLPKFAAWSSKSHAALQQDGRQPTAWVSQYFGHTSYSVSHNYTILNTAYTQVTTVIFLWNAGELTLVWCLL
uniref:Uncharacterized protein n=1 Tax=Anguilla anguilla TaxID=7936 RepID=A0A0E9X1Z6_ANGAN